jgi:hypothetical protein
MFPVDIVVAGEAQRYWWMAVNHPIARMIENNPEYESEGVWDSVYYGACVVYHCEIVEVFIDAIVDMILAQGKYLEGVIAAPAEEEAPQQSSSLDYSDWVDVRTIVPRQTPSPPPPPSPQSVISSLATRAEGSKKAD